MPALKRAFSTRRIGVLLLAAATTWYLIGIFGGSASTGSEGQSQSTSAFSFWSLTDKSHLPTPRSRVTQQLQKVLQWKPPRRVKEHYPPYMDYGDRDYDPNRWEAFSLNYDFYLNGSIDQLAAQPARPRPYNPYPLYTSSEYQSEWQGKWIACDGHDGSPLKLDTTMTTYAYDGIPDGFPVPDSGSFDAIGLDSNVCFDRFSRLGSYGLSDEMKDFYNGVKWMQLQNRCVERNQDRFTNPTLPEIGPKVQSKRSLFMGKRSPEEDATPKDKDKTTQEKEAALQEKETTPEVQDTNRPEVEGTSSQVQDTKSTDLEATPQVQDTNPPEIEATPQESETTPQQKERQPYEQITSGAKPRPRSAVLIRTWDNYVYHPNDYQAIRSLITELNLMSGGEFHVFLFVNIKNISAPLFTDRETYDALLQKHVPEEFRDIALLWTEAVCKSWYPDVGEWSVYYQQWMPLQYFSKTHPEFEYVWNWEMDARYIGNHYHFLDQVAKYSLKQPRKYMWERNSRFYFPAVHGSFNEFTEETNRIVRDSPWVNPVWGPQPWHRNQTIWGPEPPHEESEDEFEWGVGEEADFISLLPIWDPVQTLWSYRNKLWGYPPTGYFEHDGEDTPKYESVPRRTFINTLARLSKTLLDAMHHENTAGFGMASEMWPASVALQHGLKGVYVPHPIWFAHNWPAHYVEDIFNADGWGAGSLAGLGGENFLREGRGRAYDPALEAKNLPQRGTGPNHEGAIGRWSQERDNVYSPDREHNFGGWSWYFWSDFPRTLYWRWLGWKVGYGPFDGKDSRTADEMRDIDWSEWESVRGRLCYPAMLLHPVKGVIDH